VLWFLFFVLLALDRPVAKLAGGLAIIEGIATAGCSASSCWRGSSSFEAGLIWQR